MVTRQRSPNYPGIDLEAAIRALHDLYRKVGRGQFSVADAAASWNYNSPSGPARSRLAALRQYGLLEGKKGENPRLSRLGLTFVLRNQASKEYRDALQTAAIEPPLFNELQQSRRGVADGALREYLILDRNFTDDGAGRFIEVYRATMRLANLITDDIISGLEEDEYTDGSEDDMVTETPSQSAPASPTRYSVPEGSITIPVPLSESRIATITISNIFIFKFNLHCLISVTMHQIPISLIFIRQCKLSLH